MKLIDIATSIHNDWDCPAVRIIIRVTGWRCMLIMCIPGWAIGIFSSIVKNEKINAK